MIQQRADVLFNQAVGPDYYHIGLACPQGYADAFPGQFVMIRIGDDLTPLLRRPFSIHRVVASTGEVSRIELLYKVVGEGTRKLARVGAGVQIDVLGPLGNSFRIPDKLDSFYLAAGGIGVAPMVFLADHLKKAGYDLARGAVYLGGRSAGDLLCRDIFIGYGMNVHLTTDDGTAGDQCLVTHPLELALKDHKPVMIYACGPMPMLTCVIGLAEKHHVSCQISIETMMACGMGACLGCAVEVNTGDGYRHTCLDGPVFDADQLKI